MKPQQLHNNLPAQQQGAKLACNCSRNHLSLTLVNSLCCSHAFCCSTFSQVLLHRPLCIISSALSLPGGILCCALGIISSILGILLNISSSILPGGRESENNSEPTKKYSKFSRLQIMVNMCTAQQCHPSRTTLVGLKLICPHPLPARSLAAPLASPALSFTKSCSKERPMSSLF